jgi:hypothetical protein
MTAATRALLVSFWILAVGLTAVLLEVEDVRAGVRIRSLLIEKDSRIERFRRLELRFNRMASPDLLQKRLPEDFREPVVESKDRKPRVQG